MEKILLMLVTLLVILALFLLLLLVFDFVDSIMFVYVFCDPGHDAAEEIIQTEQDDYYGDLADDNDKTN